MGRPLVIAAVLGLLAVLVEIVVFIGAVRWMGGAATLLLVLLTSILGAFVLRREGVRAWRRLRVGTAGGPPPGAEVTRGLVGLTGGFLLLLPGFVTDLVGLLLLSPPGRAATGAGIRRAAERRLSGPVAGQVFGPRRVKVRTGRPVRTAPPDAGTQPPPPVIEGEIVDRP